MQTSQDTISSPKIKDYRVTRLSKDNLADVAKLHEVVYGVAPSPGYFNKKYDTRYTGVEYVGFIAYNSDNMAVAYYGVLPCFMEYNDSVMLSAQSADTMTHPEFRYKGMFVALSDMTFDLCRQLGIRLIFGFPNQNSYPGMVSKLAWKVTELMTCFKIPVKTFPLESFSIKVPGLNRLYKGYRNSILSKKLLALQGVRNSVLADGFAGLQRNGEFLDYKSYSPAKVIGIEGAKIWLSNKQGFIIGDIEGLTEANFSRVISKLHSMVKRLGVREWQFHCSPGTSLHSLFARRYPQTPSYPVLFQNFGSAIAPEKIKFTFADIDIF